MGTFRLTLADGHHWLAARQPEGYRTMYAFDLIPQLPADYQLGNWYTSTSPTAPFLHVLIMERLSADKRFKLINRRFAIEARDGEVVVEHEIATPDELGHVLAETFGVVPPVPVAELFAKIAG